MEIEPVYYIYVVTFSWHLLLATICDMIIIPMRTVKFECTRDDVVFLNAHSKIIKLFFNEVKIVYAGNYLKLNFISAFHSSAAEEAWGDRWT